MPNHCQRRGGWIGCSTTALPSWTQGLPQPRRTPSLPGFLRGIGWPERLINNWTDLTDEIQFYPVFISYSREDEELARKVHDALQDRGVRCWFAPEKLRGGDRLLDNITTAIRLYDRFILCLSATSLESGWVRDELDRAIDKERRLPMIDGNRPSTIIPVDLDGAIWEWKGAEKESLVSRLILDFTRWEEEDAFKAGLHDLLKALDVYRPPGPPTLLEGQ